MHRTNGLSDYRVMDCQNNGLTDYHSNGLELGLVVRSVTHLKSIFTVIFVSHFCKEAS